MGSVGETIDPAQTMISTALEKPDARTVSSYIDIISKIEVIGEEILAEISHRIVSYCIVQFVIIMGQRKSLTTESNP